MKRILSCGDQQDESISFLEIHHLQFLFWSYPQCLCINFYVLFLKKYSPTQRFPLTFGSARKHKETQWFAKKELWQPVFLSSLAPFWLANFKTQLGINPHLIFKFSSDVLYCDECQMNTIFDMFDNGFAFPSSLQILYYHATFKY